MNLFKERVLELAKLSLAFVAVLAIAAIVALAVGLALYGLDWIYPDLSVYMLFAAIGVYLLVQAVKLVKWLFIEPFKKTNQ